MDLRRCTELSPGFSIEGPIKHDSAGTHQVIVPRHLSEGRPYVFSERDELRVTLQRDLQRYRVSAGDVLVLSRGARNSAFFIQKVPSPTVAPLLFFILHPGSQIDGAYLTWYLNLESTKARLQQMRSGTRTPLLHSRELGKLEVPLPPLDVQRQIARLANLMFRQRQLQDELRIERDRMHALVGRQILNSLVGWEERNG